MPFEPIQHEPLHVIVAVSPAAVELELYRPTGQACMLVSLHGPPLGPAKPFVHVQLKIRELPAGEYAPNAQLTQLAAPEAGEYESAGHVVHIVAPVDAL